MTQGSAGKSITRSALILAALPFLAAFLSFMLPYGASLKKAFEPEEVITVWENSSLFNVAFFTVKQAFLSVLVSLALGLPGAWLTARGGSRVTPVLRSLSAIPFAMPSILVVLGFVLFFGNSGWVNRLLAFLPESFDLRLRILYKPEAIILAHGFFNFPLVMRLVGDGLERASKAYAPAAASLGAPPLKTAFTVILPLCVPSLMSAVLLVFLYSFTSFAVVLVLGGGPASTTLAVEIYRHARIFLNYGNAGALALVETLVALSVFFTYIIFGKKMRETKTDIQERVMEKRRNPPFLKILALLYSLCAAFFILGPLFSIPLESFLYSPSRSAAQVFGFKWWQSLGDTCLPALGRSLLLAFFSATASCILASLAAGAVKLLDETGRANKAAANIIRFFAASPVVSSGVVLGLGWLIVYGRNFSRSLWALVILHAVTVLPFAFNSISEGLRSLPANTLNAAYVSGAAPVRGLLTTALPLSLGRIRTAWGFAAALSFGELNALMMLGIEGWETLPLYIYRAVGAYRYGEACAAGTLLMLCCTAAFLLSDFRLSGRSKKHDT